MRAVVEHDCVRRVVRVFVLRDATIGQQVMRLDADRLPMWDDAPAGAAVAPTLEVPEHVFALMVQEGMQIVPADNVMERAWKDAMGVRDRLLTIIEGSQT